MLTRAVMGHGWFYYVTIASVLLVLALRRTRRSPIFRG
jgi:hypothetical protein